ncbi:hypothetical protein FACS1894109_11530 [Spirochaetia bacterium]|nr:hypothetical protein FACS1894109_11530 [Spirochaetia bacterium]
MYFCSQKCKFEWEESRKPKKTGSTSSNGSCFITTAVCKTMTKPDDCVELETLRNFRDTFMMETPGMHDEVHEYYHIAPQICRAIEKTEDSGAKVYSEIWKKYLEPAVEAVNAGKKQEAHDIYRGMVLDLKAQYLG